MMPIEFRQRTPLGVFERTPLGVFGQVPEEETALYTGQVTTIAQASWPTGGRIHASGNDPADPTCGVLRNQSDSTSPTTEGWVMVVRVDDTITWPDFATYKDWRIVGDTSGAEIVPGAERPDSRCRASNYDTCWSLTGFTMANGWFSPDYSLRVADTGADSTFDFYQHVGFGAFIEGETVTVFG